MTKTTFTATHNGKTFKRTTSRDYTHAIISETTEGRLTVSWAGSLERAQKKAAADARATTGKEIRGRWKPKAGPKVYVSVVVVPVN